MDADAIYRMGDREYTYDELCEAVEAEAATFPPETWRGGEFDLNDYLIESMQVGIIEQTDSQRVLLGGRPIPTAGRHGERVRPGFHRFPDRYDCMLGGRVARGRDGRSLGGFRNPLVSWRSLGPDCWAAKAVLNLWLSLGLPFASRRR
jgi:hypothetical protein